MSKLGKVILLFHTPRDNTGVDTYYIIYALKHPARSGPVIRKILKNANHLIQWQPATLPLEAFFFTSNHLMLRVYKI